jgi:hypothetical protein
MRLAAAILGISLTAPLVIDRAAAQDGPTLDVTTSGWAWQAQRRGVPDLGAFSGVPAGDIAVAAAGQPDKLAYVELADAAIPALRDGNLRMLLDPSATQLRAPEAFLRACLVVTPWEPGAPMAWDDRPRTKCEAAPQGRYVDSPPAFSFDLSAITEDLRSDTVHGLSIEPGDSNSGPFQVVFIGHERGGISAESSASPGPTTTDRGEAIVPGGGASDGVPHDGGGSALTAAVPLDLAGEAGPTLPSPATGARPATSVGQASAARTERQPTTTGITAGLVCLSVLAVLPRLARPVKSRSTP